MPLHEIIGRKCNRKHWEQLAARGLGMGGGEKTFGNALELLAWSFGGLCFWFARSKSVDGLAWRLYSVPLK